MATSKMIRTARRASVLLAVFVVGTGCATKRDVRDLQTEIQALSQRQAALLQELQAMGMATQDTLRSTSQELFDIRGDVVRQLDRMSQQLDRLAELVGQNSLGITGLRDQMDQLRRSGVASRMPAGMEGDGMQPRRGAGGTVNDGAAADEAYQTAIDLFNRGSFTAAGAAFRDFLDRFPRDELAPQAHFKMGDVLLEQGDPQGALDEFGRIPELFPTDPLVPDALYRMALVHIEEDREDEAIGLLRRVVNSYPDSPAYSLARDRLDEIGGTPRPQS